MLDPRKVERKRKLTCRILKEMVGQFRVTLVALVIVEKVTGTSSRLGLGSLDTRYTCGCRYSSFHRRRSFGGSQV
jgi:hypothetical protein